MNTGLPGYCNKGIPVLRVLCHSLTEVTEVSGQGYGDLTELTEVPGTGTEVLQKSQKFRVLWHGCTERTEVPGRYANAVPVPRVFVARAYRAHRVPGTGLKVVQNLQKFRVRV